MGLGYSTPANTKSDDVPHWARHQLLLNSPESAKKLKTCTQNPRQVNWVRHEFCIQSHRRKRKTGAVIVPSEPLPNWVRNQFAGLL